MNGRGIYTFRSGKVIDGVFADGMHGNPDGVGRCEYINGDVYEGGFKSHSPHGKGIMHFASGKKYAAVWEYGKAKEQLLKDLDYINTGNKVKKEFDEQVDIYALVVGVAHGLNGSFIPSDFDGFANNITYSEIVKILDASDAKSKICIADACHSGSLVSARTPFQTSLDGYYDLLGKTAGGTALMMSSSAEEVSLEYSGLRQGVFSHYLLRGMKGEADTNRDKIVNITELYRFISEGVAMYTANAQTPLLTGSYDANMPVAMIR